LLARGIRFAAGSPSTALECGRAISKMKIPQRLVVGILDVTLLQASGIPNKSMYGPQDVYAKILCEPEKQSRVSLHTKTVKGGGVTPILNQRLQVGIPDGLLEFRCELWMASHNRGTVADERLAVTRIRLEDILSGCAKDKPLEFPLVESETSSTPAGVLKLSAAFHCSKGFKNTSVPANAPPARGQTRARAIANALSQSLGRGISRARSRPLREMPLDGTLQSPEESEEESCEHPCKKQRRADLTVDIEAALRRSVQESERTSSAGSSQDAADKEELRVEQAALFLDMPKCEVAKSKTTSPRGHGNQRRALRLGSICIPDLDIDNLSPRGDDVAAFSKYRDCQCWSPDPLSLWEAPDLKDSMFSPMGPSTPGLVGISEDSDISWDESFDMVAVSLETAESVKRSVTSNY